MLLAGLALAPALASAQTPDTVVVSWTSPGDDGTRGTATSYDLRVSGSPITPSNFDEAMVVPGTPAPLPSGTTQRVTVRGLSREQTYYFALKSADNRGNWSGMSNLVRWDWQVDASPPSPPRGVRAKRGNGGMHVTWDANGEPDLAGYNLYRAVNGGTPVRLNSALISGTEFVDGTAPESDQGLAYDVTAVDARGHESAMSLAAMPGVGDEWTLEPGYPNPSRLTESVRLPVVVPSSGGNALVQILDSGGRIVRRLTLSSLSPGTTEVVWDGRNESGRATAPGVYRAWLIVGDVRTSARLLRVP